MTVPSFPPDPLTLVIFGGTGDLTRRKLLPGLFNLYREGLLPEDFRVVGFGRRDYDDRNYRSLMSDSVNTFSAVTPSVKEVDRFFERVSYFRGDLDDTASFKNLAAVLGAASRYPANRIFYLSIAAHFFSPVMQRLKAADLLSPAGDTPWTRVVIEKPFGRDLTTARALNLEIKGLLDESQIYRIDHYLGKETVQNILSFRFANAIFEPLFNNRFVDHIQVTASESVGMESGRGAFYDRTGALRDMVQNHLLQLLCLVCMEPPSGLTAEALRQEKVKVLQAIRPPDPAEVSRDFIRGQYGAGEWKGVSYPAYVDEERVPADSRTETFVAARLSIDNWRWAGVPMILRTGKHLAGKETQIAIQFKQPPLQLFQSVECEGDVCDLTDARPNLLTLRIVPDEGIGLRFGVKRPVMQVVVEQAEMDFNYAETWDRLPPEAYQRLLHDVMRGDSTLFTRGDEAEAAWRILEPVQQAWEKDASLPLHIYAPGSRGPGAMDALLPPGAVWQGLAGKED